MQYFPFNKKVILRKTTWIHLGKNGSSDSFTAKLEQGHEGKIQWIKYAVFPFQQNGNSLENYRDMPSEKRSDTWNSHYIQYNNNYTAKLEEGQRDIIRHIYMVENYDVLYVVMLPCSTKFTYTNSQVNIRKEHLETN